MVHVARRASWIYEQAGQTLIHNAPDDAGVRKGLEETTGHKDVINMSLQAQPCDPTGNYSRPSPFHTAQVASSE